MEQALLVKPETDQVTSIAPAVSASRKMDHSLLRSVAWNAFSDWTSQILTWISFLFVLRLLAPADFGIVGMTVVLLPLAYTSTFGIGRAVVSMPDLTKDQLAQLNTVGLMLGIGSYAIAAAIAKPAAWFFHTPKLVPVILVSSLGMLMTGAQLVSNGLMMKHLRFPALCLFNAITAVITAAITLVLAWMGWGYWALIIGGLVGGTLRNGLVLWTERPTYAIPRWRSIREPLRFGRHIVVSLLALDTYQSLDNFIAGRTLGAAALGLYGMAWTLAHVPLEKVASMVTTVISSYLVAVRDDLGAMRRYLRNLTESIALLTFPGCVGLGLVAREFVPVILGKKWEGAIGALSILSIYTAFRSIVALLPKVLVAMGNPKFVMWNDLAALVVLGAGFYIGSHWGITGIAWGWVVAYPWVVLPLYRKTFLTIGMGLREYMRSLRPALEGTIVMVVCVECTVYALSGYRSLILRLALEVAVGVVGYTGILWLRHKERMLTFIEMAKSFRRGEKC